MKVVIVGGVAGGASAAARLRRLNEQAKIVVLERSNYVSYANCGLPYYVGGVITDRSKLTLQTPKSFRERFDIDVRVRNEAFLIDVSAKEVLVRRLDDGSEYREPYDKLILSPGARPIVPDVEGIHCENLYVLRTVEDAFALYDFVSLQKPARAAVVGGGFIGLEVTENLAMRGINVTLYQRESHLLPVLDDEMACFVQKRMRSAGVELKLGSQVTGFSNVAHDVVVRADGEERRFDMVVLAAGVAPDSTLAASAGLDLGVKGAIVVDGHMRTSNPDIYAVGDAVQVRQVVSRRVAHIALAGPANRQGRVAADNICGIETSYDGALGSSVIKVFDLTVAATGLSADAAERAGIKYDSVLLSPASHATYYPGSSTLRLKVIFQKGIGRVLGAQAVGREGVEKRIDVLATAIRARMDSRDLADLDLTYAPPFSTATDPVNAAGRMIENLLDGLVRQVRWSQALALGDDDVLLDVRTPVEVARGTVPGALRIPVDELRERVGELPRDKRVFVFCQTGLRSYLACRFLAQRGYSCANVAGGYAFYEAGLTDVPCAFRAASSCVTQGDEGTDSDEGRGACGL